MSKYRLIATCFTVFLGILLTTAGATAGSTNPGDAILIITEETDANTVPFRQLRVSCPEGYTVTGGGWAVLRPDFAILGGTATYNMPSYDGRSWMVNAAPPAFYADPWMLQVRIICIKGG